MAKQEYAGFLVRFAAAMIDGVLLGITRGFYGIIVVYLVAKYGETVGKRVMGLRILNEQGRPEIGLMNAMIRELFGKFVSGFFLGLGYLWIIFDDEKRGWHDKIAKTHVMYAKDAPKPKSRGTWDIPP